MFATVRSPNGQTGTAGNAASTSGTLTIPTGAVTGDWLIAVVAAGANVTVTWPTGYTQLLSYQPSANLGLYIAYARYVPGTTGTAYTLASAFHTNQVWAVAQGGASNPEVGAGDQTLAGADPPALSPSWGVGDNGWIVVDAFLDGTRSVTTWPTGYTLNQNTVKSTSVSGTGVAMAARGSTGATEDPAAFVMSTSARNYGCVIGLRGSIQPHVAPMVPLLAQ